MDYLIFLATGLLMGTFGGLLGIGGSVVMIPVLVTVLGENQHLYQASAMICNVFVGAGAILVHRSAKSLVAEVVKWLVPAAVMGIIIGVAASNCRVFAAERSYHLAHLFGVFLIYAVIYNCLRLLKTMDSAAVFDMAGVKQSTPLTIGCGFFSGFSAGLLGLGGGLVCVPLQQLLLKMPLKKAVSNSAAMIASIALIGAVYKNVTLPQHGIAITESLKMAVFIVPGAFAGAYIGGHLVHKLPTKAVRIVFILLAALASYKLLSI